jgi:type I restriction enzyme, R subunit
LSSKKTLSERDICTKFITPALLKAGWDIESQILEEVSFTDGKIFVRGKLTARGKRKRADYILYYNANPVAIIEAKDNSHSINSGIQQALDYARVLDIPCVFSSNGDGFLFHDRTVSDSVIEKELDLDSFPSPQDLWTRFKTFKGILNQEQERVISQAYYSDGSGRKSRYYQEVAINRTIDNIVKGKQRVLLVMATGTGKTYTAFQIVYRLWKAKVKKRILFLADRNVLISQTKNNDFRHFGDKMTWVKNRQVDKSYEIYLALYQGISGSEDEANIYKQFSPDFFDLVVIDECHRGSAKDDSAWREILAYFKNATHLGLTATPKETTEISNIEYFGDPIYTYSLKQGIDDGFLAPYRVVRIGLNIDLEGWRPQQGKLDKEGNLIEDRIYNRKDFDRNIVIDERTDLVAKKITEFLQGAGRFSKTIVFCVDINHAERMRSALANHNTDLISENYKYIVQITGDNEEGKRELDNFINVEEKYPVIATTSKLMSTGVDAQTCKVIVLDSNIQSMTEFKQIIGRGTRIREDFGKLYFTILDFRNVTDLFADPDFDGPPIRIKEANEDEDLTGVEEEEEETQTPIVDAESGEEIHIPKPPIRYPTAGINTLANERRPKFFVNGVDVSVLVSREMYFDNEGKPITVSLKDHTREIIRNNYASLDDFLNRWKESDKKAALIKELEDQGVLVSALLEAVNKEADLFDIIAHVAYDQPPMTRKERASNVKKRNYFTRYGEQARKVLEALLDKYADEGIITIESAEVLSIDPLSTFGTPYEIIKTLGGKEQYLQAVKDLEKHIYLSA